MDPDTSITALRCADSDRELVAGVLNRAFADGRLTFDEHDERISKAYVARTFGELDTLTEDLVPAASTRAAPAAAPSSASAVSIPSQHGVARNSNALRSATAVMSTLRPGTGLHLAEHTHFNVWLAELRLDLVDATFAAPTVQLELGVVMGDVQIRVPAGVTVVQRLSAMMGEVKVVGARPGNQVVELVGTVALGEITVLGPDAPARKYTKFRG